MTKLLKFATTEVESLPEADQNRVAETMLTDAKKAAVRQGIKAADEGRMVDHNRVTDWLESWGTDKETPPPKCK